jgi:hypothetical protein
MAGAGGYKRQAERDGSNLEMIACGGFGRSA